VYFVATRFGGVQAGIAVLISGSLYFYSWWAPINLWVLLLSIAVNAGLAVALIRKKIKSRVWILVGGLVFNLVLLGYFKYAAFLVENINAAFSLNWNAEPRPLPLGISFFTFQKIAFLVDAFAGGVLSFSLLNYCLFVTFFPQLIAGPIVRHNEIIPQFQNLATRPKAANFAIGSSIFTIGLFKKICLADPCAVLVNPVFSAAAAGVPVGFVETWVAALAYSFQLYFDFSGYGDMAVGLARLFGIVLPLNFFSPYKATNIIEFWRRWNITLSRFLRDFLYIPLGGNRHGTGRRFLNLMLTMLLGGLWHGASWTFVLWGGVHGLLLCMNHAWHALRRWIGFPAGNGSALGSATACFVTFVIVTNAWVLFRAPSLASAGTILSTMYGVGDVDIIKSTWKYFSTERDRLVELRWADSGIVWLLVVAFVAFILPNSYQVFENRNPALVERPFDHAAFGLHLRWQPDWRWALCLSLMLLMATLQLSALSPFIYFQF